MGNNTESCLSSCQHHHRHTFCPTDDHISLTVVTPSSGPCSINPFMTATLSNKIGNGNSREQSRPVRLRGGRNASASYLSMTTAMTCPAKLNAIRSKSHDPPPCQRLHGQPNKTKPPAGMSTFFIVNNHRVLRHGGPPGCTT